jgi:hypothetical protein
MAEKKMDSSTAGAVSAGTGSGEVSQLPYRVAPGDATYVFFAGVARPINCGSKERAAFIVRACNSHHKMLEALKAAEAHCKKDQLDGVDFDETAELLDVIRNATKGA